ncbi:hypothetical protein SAMN02745116_00167 [Pilibacter termitis]|uniref:Uncharacterized protein n=1 Tax=Pilibacter termitis TaxID=263852 RepID=A0A1T4KBA9_9ENTE|nr:hypothetical protein [Pilibacter termitis]SJZ39676.1 hypothetical protein SAMN02745116_00167 [Pilibacter termitis]
MNINQVTFFQANTMTSKNTFHITEEPIPTTTETYSFMPKEIMPSMNESISFLACFLGTCIVLLSLYFLLLHKRKA